MNGIVRETRQTFVVLCCQYFRLICTGRRHNEVRDLTEVHLKIPTFTFRNRAGEAPWPVPIVCIGSPLPQFGVPQSVQCFSLVIASHAFQKSGVMPAYVQFFSRRPSLPFLIS